MNGGYRDREVFLFMDLYLSDTEEILKIKMIKFLQKWFTVVPEVTSDCRKGRIDILMTHQLQNNKEFQIGIELKKTENKRGNSLALWLNQANDYTNMLFNGKRTFVFVAPQVSWYYLKEGSQVSQHPVFVPGSHSCQYNVNGFLYGSFGIGEVQKYKNYLGENHIRLVINTFQIWCSQEPYRFDTKKLSNL